jgi:antitoxin MazE
MRISKWGNSLAVRLPREVAEQLGLKLGDEVELQAGEGKVLTVSTKEAERRAALERLREFRGLLPADYKFDREEAHER